VPTRGLLEAILEEVRRHCADHGIPDCDVAIDVADRHVLQVDRSTVRDILAGLLLRAFDNAARPAAASDAPHVREIVVTSIEHAHAIEIEVADSGPVASAGRVAALTAARAFTMRHGGHVAVRPCPEGGTAVTIHLPHRQASRRAA